MPRRTLHSLLKHKKWNNLPMQIALHPREIHTWDRHGNLPIHVACQQSQIPMEVVTTLVEHDCHSLQVPTKACGRLPLHCAVSRTDVTDMLSVVTFLVTSWETAAGVRDKDGVVPLQAYLLRSLPPCGDVVRVLVQAYPQAVEYCDRGGSLPLHIVAKYNEGDVVKYLMELYPKALRVVNKWGRTPKDTAHWYGQHILCEYLEMEERTRFGSNENEKDQSDSSCSTFCTGMGEPKNRPVEPVESSNVVDLFSQRRFIVDSTDSNSNSNSSCVSSSSATSVVGSSIVTSVVDNDHHVHNMASNVVDFFSNKLQVRSRDSKGSSVSRNSRGSSDSRGSSCGSSSCVTNDRYV